MPEREVLPRPSSTACTCCGMALDGHAEFHPYVFCVLKQAGRDPWEDFRWLTRLYYGASSAEFEALPERPPEIRDTPREAERADV